MAHPDQAGHPTAPADNPIAALLRSPLAPQWSVDDLAEQLLRTVAAEPSAAGERQEFVLDAEDLIDRQSRRLIRPLLACLATKSAAETGSSQPDLYGGQLSFVRPGPEGPVRILGRFENRPDTVRLVFSRSDSSAGASVPPSPSEAGFRDPHTSGCDQ